MNHGKPATGNPHITTTQDYKSLQAMIDACLQSLHSISARSPRPLKDLEDLNALYIKNIYAIVDRINRNESTDLDYKWMNALVQFLFNIEELKNTINLQTAVAAGRTYPLQTTTASTATHLSPSNTELQNLSYYFAGNKERERNSASTVKYTATAAPSSHPKASATRQASTSGSAPPPVYHQPAPPVQISEEAALSAIIDRHSKVSTTPMSAETKSFLMSRYNYGSDLLTRSIEITECSTITCAEKRGPANQASLEEVLSIMHKVSGEQQHHSARLTTFKAQPTAAPAYQGPAVAPIPSNAPSQSAFSPLASNRSLNSSLQYASTPARAPTQQQRSATADASTSPMIQREGSGPTTVINNTFIISTNLTSTSGVHCYASAAPAVANTDSERTTSKEDKFVPIPNVLTALPQSPDATISTPTPPASTVEATTHTNSKHTTPPREEVTTESAPGDTAAPPPSSGAITSSIQLSTFKQHPTAVTLGAAAPSLTSTGSILASQPSVIVAINNNANLTSIDKTIIPAPSTITAQPQTPVASPHVITAPKLQQLGKEYATATNCKAGAKALNHSLPPAPETLQALTIIAPSPPPIVSMASSASLSSPARAEPAAINGSTSTINITAPLPAAGVPGSPPPQSVRPSVPLSPTPSGLPVAQTPQSDSKRPDSKSPSRSLLLPSPRPHRTPTPKRPSGTQASEMPNIAKVLEYPNENDSKSPPILTPSNFEKKVIAASKKHIPNPDLDMLCAQAIKEGKLDDLLNIPFPDDITDDAIVVILAFINEDDREEAYKILNEARKTTTFTYASSKRAGREDRLNDCELIIKEDTLDMIISSYLHTKSPFLMEILTALGGSDTALITGKSLAESLEALRNSFAKGDCKSLEVTLGDLRLSNPHWIGPSVTRTFVLPEINPLETLGTCISFYANENFEAYYSSYDEIRRATIMRDAETRAQLHHNMKNCSSSPNPNALLTIADTDKHVLKMLRAEADVYRNQKLRAFLASSAISNGVAKNTGHAIDLSSLANATATASKTAAAANHNSHKHSSL